MSVDSDWSSYWMQPAAIEADWARRVEGVYCCRCRFRSSCKCAEAPEAEGSAGCCNSAAAAAVAGYCRTSSSWMVVPGRRTAAVRRWGFVRSPVADGLTPGSCLQNAAEVVVVAAAAVAAGIAAAAAAKEKDWLEGIHYSCPGYGMLLDLGPWPARFNQHPLHLITSLITIRHWVMKERHTCGSGVMGKAPGLLW